MTEIELLQEIVKDVSLIWWLLLGVDIGLLGIMMLMVMAKKRRKQ